MKLTFFQKIMYVICGRLKVYTDFKLFFLQTKIKFSKNIYFLIQFSKARIHTILDY